jgi:hypothetical protein
MNYSAMLSLVFLSFTFFLFSDHFRTFSQPIFECILLIFFIRKIKNFATNCWNRFLKYVSDVQIHETLGNYSKQFSPFSVQNSHYTSTKTNIKNLFQQFVGTNFSFILKQISPLSGLPCTGKMFRAKSPVFRTKYCITSQL